MAFMYASVATVRLHARIYTFMQHVMYIPWSDFCKKSQKLQLLIQMWQS